MVTDPARLTRNKLVLVRGGMLVLLLAVLVFVPSPSGNIPAMVFESLLMVIFTMIVTGTSGAAVMFITLSAIATTVLLPVLLLTVSIASASGGYLAALVRVFSVLTDPNPIEAFYLIVPSLVACVLGVILGKTGFRLPGY